MNKRLKTIIFLTISIFIFIQSCAYVTTPLISKKDKKADAAVAEEYYTKSLDAEKNGDIYNALVYLKLALAKNPKNKRISGKYKSLIESLHSEITGSQEILKKGRGFTNPVIYKLYRKVGNKISPIQGMPVHFKLINATGKITENGITNDIGETKCFIDIIDNYTNNVSVEVYVIIPNNKNGETINKLTKSFTFNNTSMLDKNIKILLKLDNPSKNDNILNIIYQPIIESLNQEGFTDISIMPSYNTSLFDSAMEMDKTAIQSLGNESASDIFVLLTINDRLNLQQSFDFYLKKVLIRIIIADAKSGEVYLSGLIEGKGADRTEKDAEEKAIKNAISKLEKILKNYLEEVKTKNEFIKFLIKDKPITSGS